MNQDLVSRLTMRNGTWRSRCYAALFATFLVFTLVLGCDRTGEEAPSVAVPTVSLDWGGGQHSFEVKLRSRARLPGGTDQFELLMNGHLHVKVVESDNESTILAVVFTGVEGELAGAASSVTEAVLAPLSKPAYLKVHHGKLTDSWFPSGGGAVGMGLWRTVASSLQLVEGQSGASEWKAKEYDPTGLVEVTYAVSKGADARLLVTKTKTGYERLLTPTMGTMTAPAGPTIKMSKTTMNFAQNELTSLKLKDSLEAPMVQGSSVLAEVEVDLKRVKAGGGPRLTLAGWESRHEDHLHLPPDRMLPVDSAETRGLFDKERTKGHTFEGVLSAFSDANAKHGMKERMDLHFALVSFLRSQSSRIPVALREVNQKTHAASEVLSALGSAGTSEAQRALSEVIASENLGERLREKAILALSRVDEPTQESMKVMIGQLSDELIGNQVLFGLGAMSRRFRDRGAAPPVHAIRKVLEESLRSASSPRRYKEALGGVANSGDSYFLETLKKAATHEDSAVRAIAAKGLKHQVSDEVDGVLVLMLETEDDKHVQHAILQIFQKRDLTPAAVAAVEKFLRTDGLDESVRGRAQRLQETWQDTARL